MELSQSILYQNVQQNPGFVVIEESSKRFLASFIDLAKETEIKWTNDISDALFPANKKECDLVIELLSRQGYRCFIDYRWRYVPV